MASLKSVSILRTISKYKPILVKPTQIRYISTSKKNRDTASVASEVHESTVCEANKRKNWISYGFSHTDYDEDRHYMHMTFFIGVTLCLCGGSFILIYRPDIIGKDWAHREAFLELRRREKLGLPLVDPDYIPASKIVLPSDEELGDTEIII